PVAVAARGRARGRDRRCRARWRAGDGAGPSLTARWLPVPTGRLALVAALLAVAVALFPGDSTAGLVVVNLVLLVVALADWAIAVRPDAIGFERSVPGILALHQPARIEWTVTNPGTPPVHVAFADELAPSLLAGRRRVSLVV